MSTIYRVATDTTTITLNTKTDMLKLTKELTDNGTTYSVEQVILTSNIRRLLNKGYTRLKVRTDNGREYIITAGNPGPNKPIDRDREHQARSQGKDLVYNVKSMQWQVLNIIEIEVDGKFLPIEKVETKRLSLEEAIQKLINLGYMVYTDNNKHTVCKEGSNLFENPLTGRELVKFASTC